MYKIEKFQTGSRESADFFVNNGFVSLKNVFDRDRIEALGRSVHDLYLSMRPNEAGFASDGQSALMASRDIVERSSVTLELDSLMKDEALLDGLESFLGLDISLVNHINLWVNDPQDRAKVTNKSLHQEIWTGAGVEDVIVWIPISPVDQQNTMNVVPRSHLYGFLPNRNRKLEDIDGFSHGEVLPLTGFEYGDLVVFHSLLLHGTAGRSDKFRYSLSAAYKNSYAPTSRKYQSVGSIGLRFGPLTRINHVLGNDLLSPLRTYGGPASNHPECYENKK